jgi:hypothetical protein
MESHWVESDDSLQLRSAHHTGCWSLRWTGSVPGLYWANISGQPATGPILGVSGIAAEGYLEPVELTSKNLTQLEVVKNRVDLYYHPESWHETQIRLSWWPSGQDQFDLMTEISTRSVGMLKAVELCIYTTLTQWKESDGKWFEAFRDQEAAMRSTDGRDASWFNSQSVFQPEDTESNLYKINSWLPVLLVGSSGYPKILETTHPDDISRRYRDFGCQSLRTWTFGYDMERGVVFRGRHRCRLVQNHEIVNSNSVQLWQNEFISEPLPLFR